MIPVQTIQKTNEAIHNTPISNTECGGHDSILRAPYWVSDGAGVSPAVQVNNLPVTEEDDVFVSESESDGEALIDGAFSYLESVTTDRGGSELSDSEIVKERVLKSIDMCGGSARYGQGNTSGRFTYMPNFCKLIYCPDCSREGGPIEKLRLGRLRDRVDLNEENIRALEYTVPMDIRPFFHSRNGVNALMKMSTKISLKVFGKDARMTVNPHLVGDKSDIFHPHVNVMIFEKKGVMLKISEDQLDLLKKLWKQALEGFTRVKIPVVDVHYSFKITMGQKRHIVRYNLRANFKYNTDTLMMISSDEFKRFQWLRFRGGLKKKGERDLPDSEVLISEIEKQAGEKISWLGTVSMKELRMRFGDIEIERVPGPLVMYRETIEARKKRKKDIKIY